MIVKTKSNVFHSKYILYDSWGWGCKRCTSIWKINSAFSMSYSQAMITKDFNEFSRQSDKILSLKGSVLLACPGIELIFIIAHWQEFWKANWVTSENPETQENYGRCLSVTSNVLFYGCVVGGLASPSLTPLIGGEEYHPPCLYGEIVRASQTSFLDNQPEVSIRTSYTNKRGIGCG